MIIGNYEFSTKFLILVGVSTISIIIIIVYFVIHKKTTPPPSAPICNKGNILQTCKDGSKKCVLACEGLGKCYPDADDRCNFKCYDPNKGNCIDGHFCKNIDINTRYDGKVVCCAPPKLWDKLSNTCKQCPPNYSFCAGECFDPKENTCCGTTPDNSIICSYENCIQLAKKSGQKAPTGQCKIGTANCYGECCGGSDTGKYIITDNNGCCPLNKVYSKGGKSSCCNSTVCYDGTKAKAICCGEQGAVCTTPGSCNTTTNKCHQNTNFACKLDSDCLDLGDAISQKCYVVKTLDGKISKYEPGNSEVCNPKKQANPQDCNDISLNCKIQARIDPARCTTDETFKKNCLETCGACKIPDMNIVYESESSGTDTGCSYECTGDNPIYCPTADSICGTSTVKDKSVTHCIGNKNYDFDSLNDNMPANTPIQFSEGGYTRSSDVPAFGQYYEVDIDKYAGKKYCPLYNSYTNSPTMDNTQTPMQIGEKWFCPLSVFQKGYLYTAIPTIAGNSTKLHPVGTKYNVPSHFSGKYIRDTKTTEGGGYGINTLKAHPYLNSTAPTDSSGQVDPSNHLVNMTWEGQGDIPTPTFEFGPYLYGKNSAAALGTTATDAVKPTTHRISKVNYTCKDGGDTCTGPSLIDCYTRLESKDLKSVELNTDDNYCQGYYAPPTDDKSWTSYPSKGADDVTKGVTNYNRTSLLGGTVGLGIDNGGLQMNSDSEFWSGLSCEMGNQQMSGTARGWLSDPTNKQPLTSMVLCVYPPPSVNALRRAKGKLPPGV